MDETTYNVRFESMRKAPPGGRRSNKNKQIVARHRELEKDCSRLVSKHRQDTKWATAQLRREQLVTERKQELYRREQQQFQEASRRVQRQLEVSEQSRTVRAGKAAQDGQSLQHEMFKNDRKAIMALLNKMALPTKMKERLLSQYEYLSMGSY